MSCETTPIYYQGDTPLLSNSFTDDDGTALSLAGLSASDFAMHFLSPGGTHRLGVGTWSNVGGVWKYQVNASDFVEGLWKIYPVVQFANGPEHMDPQVIQVVNLPG